MQLFSLSVIIYICICWVVPISELKAMEPNVVREDKPWDIPRTPYECFSLRSFPIPDELKEKYSIQIRTQLFNIIQLSNQEIQLTDKEKKERLESFKKCQNLCKEWKHPANDLFNNIIQLIESEKHKSPNKLQKAAHSCLKKFLKTLSTLDQIDVCEMKLMFLTKDSESNPIHYKRNSIDIVQLVEKLNVANKCEIVTCYLQHIGTGQLFGIDGLYYDEKDYTVVQAKIGT